MKSEKKFFYSGNFRNYFFWIFLILYTLLLLYVAKKINISEDETYALNTTSRNLRGVIDQSYNFEFQLPGYFVLLSLWRLFNSSIFFAKLFSIASIYLASAYAFKLGKLFFKEFNSRWISVIFLLNPFSVWGALEIRLYAFSVLLATLCLYFFYSFLLEERKRHFYYFLLFALIGIYTQYFFVFLSVVLALSTLATRKWKFFLKICLRLIPLAILFLPNFIFIPNQLRMQTAHGKDVFNFGAVSSVLHTPQNLMLAINYVPDPLNNRIIRLIFLLAFVPTYIYLFRSRNRIRNIYKNINILIIDLAMLIIIFALAVFLTNIVFTSKYMVVAYPLFVLLCCIFTILPGKLHNFIFGALSVYFAFILISFYRYPVNTYDFNSIARYIEKIEQPNEPILMYRANNALPFEYSYHGINRIIPLPKPVNFDSNYLTNIRDTLQLRSLLSNIKPRSRNFLMISDTTKFETTLDMHRKMVSDFIYKNYEVTLDTLFLGNAKGKVLRIQQFHQR